MTITEARNLALTETVANVRRIERDDGVTRASLERISAVLIRLAQQRTLFPEAHFPGPGAGESQTLYLLSEDADRRFALYVYRPGPGKETPPHNHTTWAIVAGMEGYETTQTYERVSDAAGGQSLRRLREFSVGPGEAACYLPDDFHSIHIGGDKAIMHLHMYGRSLADLPEREHFDAATGTFVKSDFTSHIRMPVTE
jgi:predicted metal-dependent enzyme (double-stranded beta helix superfamily)